MNNKQELMKNDNIGIVPLDDSLLSFGETGSEIVTVDYYKREIYTKVLRFTREILDFGRMRIQREASVYGQINSLNYSIYPSERVDCNLLILGEKQ